MLRKVLLRTALSAALLPAAHLSWAADATPEQARALEASVRAWIAEMAGPAISLADRPVQITPEGDHYRVAVPVGTMSGETTTITGTARPLDGGRWSLDGFRLPSPTRFTLDMPQPPKDGQPATTVPVTYTLSASDQLWQSLWDPTFATPSTFTSSFQGLDMQAQSSLVQQHTTVARSSSTGTLRPAGAGLVDVLSNATAESYAVTSKAPDTEQVEVTMQRLRADLEMTGVSRERAVGLVQAMTRLVGAAAARGGAAQPGTPDPALVRAMLAGLQDLASTMRLNETVDGLSFRYGSFGGTVNQAVFGLSGRSDGGMLQAAMDVGMEGLALPDLPLGDMAQLLPRRVSLRPVVSGVAVADLVRLFNEMGPGKEPSQQSVAAIFSHGGINTGLESFTIEVAGSTFTGNGKVLVRSPQDVIGTGTISATNFDTLFQTVSAMPALAQAVPVFLLAKGIGRTVENRIVWDINYSGGKVLVNGVDLAAMAAGGGAPPPQQQRQQRPQQQQQRPGSAPQR